MDEWIVITAHYDKLQLFSHCYDFIIAINHYSVYSLSYKEHAVNISHSEKRIFIWRNLHESTEMNTKNSIIRIKPQIILRMPILIEAGSLIAILLVHYVYHLSSLK